MRYMMIIGAMAGFGWCLVFIFAEPQMWHRYVAAWLAFFYSVEILKGKL